LLQELLDVDRHRARLATKIPATRETAANADAGCLVENRKLYGVRELSRALGVSPSTITNWRRSADFHRRVDVHRQVLTML
jgi:transposase-like protein